MIFPLIALSKLIAFISRFFNLGSGGTWPGELALMFYPKIFLYFADQVNKGFIIITGTNGKTTTAKLIQHILIKNNPNLKIVHNDSGANLTNGLVSAFIQKASITGRIEIDFAIFEVDEVVLPQVISEIRNYQGKIILVFMNLFRDQLDRYGEVDLIAHKWEKALASVPRQSKVILNADDPQIAYLGYKLSQKTIYFGLEKEDQFLKTEDYAVDSTYCKVCNSKLKYKGIYFSHIGIWYCPDCGYKRPEIEKVSIVSKLVGLYNDYNYLASYFVSRELGLSENKIKQSLKSFTPAFGRQEEFKLQDKKVKIFLSKNPAGFNASLRAVFDTHPKAMLLVLNDRIPDGRDVSWIWDVDFEMIPEDIVVIVSGDRTYDMGLRIKYISKAQSSKLKAQNKSLKLRIIPNLKESIYCGLKEIDKRETLYILPTYSAMLEVRKILIGRKIL